MPDSKVENYKIDPKLMKQVKKYKTLTKMSDTLKKGLAVEYTKLQQIAKAIYGTDQIRDQMLRMMNPQEPDIDQDTPNPDLFVRY